MFLRFPNFILSTLLVLSLLSSSCKKENVPEVSDTGPQQYGIPFQDIPETKRLVMYEVNIRAFSAVGDLQGVIDRIDSIDALGINAIWLMPIHPIGTINSVNSPYSVQNYLEVNPEFGTLETLRALTDAAHARGMAVILDWVANHTAWDNPWIEHTDWYTQVGGEIVHPPGTNWLDVADLNFSNLDMRKEMIAAMKYWVLEANIDGYRCDAADFVPFDFWQQAIDSLHNIPNRKLILLAEGARDDHFTAGFQMNYSWDFYGKLKDVWSGSAASGIYFTHVSEYNGIPSGGHKLRFTTNHDESAWDATPMEIFHGKNGAMAASVISVCTGGVPLIYGSQEVGTTGTVAFFWNDPIHWNINPDMLQFYKTLLQFYANSEPLMIGATTNYAYTDALCLTKKAGEEEVLVLVNVRDYTVDITLPVSLQFTEWNDVFSASTVSLDASISLAAYAYKVLYK